MICAGYEILHHNMSLPLYFIVMSSAHLLKNYIDCSRFKLILGHLQLDNQLPLTLMPVLLAPEQTSDVNHPVFKMTVTICNEVTDGIQVYPYVFVRVCGTPIDMWIKQRISIVMMTL